MNTRLYRSRTDTVIGGVCGGLGQYLGIDPVLFRIIFVLLALGSGVGFTIYLILWIIMPLEGTGEFGSAETIRAGANEVADRARTMGSSLRENVRTHNPQAALLMGTALVLMGVYFLLRSLHVPWLAWLDFDVLWPLLLIVSGVALLQRRMKEA